MPFMKADMPDSDDSFWKPLIKDELADEPATIPGAPSSSANPPAYMLRVSMDAGETSPPESVFCHEDEEPDLHLTRPFSQPPDDHTFLGLDDFARQI